MWNDRMRGCGGRIAGPRGRGWREGAGGRGRFGDHRGRRERIFDGGELRLVLLKLVAEKPRHGYDLIRAIEELTGGAYAPSPGIVYPTLTLLGEMELIDEQRAEGARKAFAITPAGEAQLAENAAVIADLFARLAALAERHGRIDGGPIRRAMGNLRGVLQARLGREDVEAETLHQVAAILDEAAQRIERL